MSYNRQQLLINKIIALCNNNDLNIQNIINSKKKEENNYSIKTKLTNSMSDYKCHGVYIY